MSVGLTDNVLLNHKISGYTTFLAHSNTANGKTQIAHVEKSHQGGYCVYFRNFIIYDDQIRQGLDIFHLSGCNLTVRNNTECTLVLIIPPHVLQNLNTSNTVPHLKLPSSSPSLFKFISPIMVIIVAISFILVVGLVQTIFFAKNGSTVADSPSSPPPPKEPTTKDQDFNDDYEQATQPTSEKKKKSTFMHECVLFIKLLKSNCWEIITFIPKLLFTLFFYEPNN